MNSIAISSDSIQAYHTPSPLHPPIGIASSFSNTNSAHAHAVLGYYPNDCMTPNTGSGGNNESFALPVFVISGGAACLLSSPKTTTRQAALADESTQVTKAVNATIRGTTMSREIKGGRWSVLRRSVRTCLCIGCWCRATTGNRRR